MSDPMNLSVSRCEHIGFCPGITKALNKLKWALILSRILLTHVWYKNLPPEAEEMVAKIKAKGLNVKEWTKKTSPLAIQMISPYGAPKSAYGGGLCADGTCEVVKRIREKAIQAHTQGKKVIFFAESSSSEIKFINTFIDDQGVIAENFDDINNLEIKKNAEYVILGQSSFRHDLFKGMSEILKELHPDVKIETIGIRCPELIKRENEIEIKSFPERETLGGRALFFDPRPTHEDVISGRVGVYLLEDKAAIIPQVLMSTIFPYDSVVLVGGLDSKQLDFLTIQCYSQVPIYRAVSVDNLGAELFHRGERVLIASGPAASNGQIEEIEKFLINLNDEQFAKVVPPDPCERCPQIKTCERHKCYGCHEAFHGFEMAMMSPREILEKVNAM